MDEHDIEVEQDLVLDRQVYGTCYWKVVDSRKVRIHPQDIRYVKGIPRDSTNTAAERAEFSAEFKTPRECVEDLERKIWKKPYGSGRQRGQRQVQCQACGRWKYANERCNLFTTLRQPDSASCNPSEK